MTDRSQEAAVLVFNRTPAALDELIQLCAPVPAMRAVVASWLADPTVEFLALISTGGRMPQTATLGARDRPHLLESVLPDAASLISRELLPTSVCTALDPAWVETLRGRWAEIIGPKH